MDPMPDFGDAAERFHIEMQQIAGMRPLIALHERRAAQGAPRD